jgi:hypothetical protein
MHLNYTIVEWNCIPRKWKQKFLGNVGLRVQNFTTSYSRVS